MKNFYYIISGIMFFLTLAIVAIGAPSNFLLTRIVIFFSGLGYFIYYNKPNLKINRILSTLFGLIGFFVIIRYFDIYLYKTNSTTVIIFSCIATIHILINMYAFIYNKKLYS